MLRLGHSWHTCFGQSEAEGNQFVSSGSVVAAALIGVKLPGKSAVPPRLINSDVSSLLPRAKALLIALFQREDGAAVGFGGGLPAKPVKWLV